MDRKFENLGFIVMRPGGGNLEKLPASVHNDMCCSDEFT